MIVCTFHITELINLKHMKSLKLIFSIVRNKYLIVVVAFLIWMAFFDANRVATHINLSKELSEVTAEKEFYISEIKKDKKRSEDLLSDDNLERYAREKHLMKRDNEDIYLIIRE